MGQGVGGARCGCGEQWVEQGVGVVRSGSGCGEEWVEQGVGTSPLPSPPHSSSHPLLYRKYVQKHGL